MTAASDSVQRRPTFAYPTLHLGSFENLSNTLALPSPSSRQSHRSSLREQQQSSTSTSPSRPQQQSTTSAFRAPDLSRLSFDDSSNEPRRRNESSRLADLPGSSTHTKRATSPLSFTRPVLPPPSLSLPPLPSLSPISPFASTHPGLPTMATLAALPIPPSIPMQPSSSSSTASSGSKQLQPLSIDIPRSFSPAPITDDLPTIRDSPSIARRRTVLPASPHANRVPSGRATRVDEGSPERRKSIESGSITMPVARPTPSTSGNDVPASPHRLEKKPSLQDLKASPTSPTPKRSLPRPPANRAAPPPLNLQINTQLPPQTTSQYQPADIFTSQQTRHVPTKSASSIPIVGGLADAGPYAGAAPRPAAGPSNVGLGRPPPRQVQEEVCIECMMRDRDLADVDVVGEGVWERESDVAWEDLKAREEDLMRSLESETGSVPSLDHSIESDDEESLPSTNHSDDPEARRRMAARTGRREQRRARRRQVDWRVANEIGWRGFKWEEGAGGEGLPRGFRGLRGGPLSEDAIKGVMKKFPSASAHRAKYLDNYLYHQAILIREVRAEAHRLGRFPMPGEERHSVLSLDGTTVLAGPRTSSVAWGQKYARDVSERAGLESVRPSPSSPADLAGLASRPQQPPPNRPQTHFYPDREPVAQRSPILQPPHPQRSPATSGREFNRRSINSMKTLDRSMRTDFWNETDEEVWPPVSPVESGLRPFSFAVRAGATAGRSSDGHNGRKSMFGRWGGSVTSFFGGSQGGSGSMMDMHLGLDSDRQNRASGGYVQPQPRAVSLASPTRPSFFSKDSKASSIHGDAPPRRVNKSLSTSRLSQMLSGEDDLTPQPESPATEKKKGFKGFLNKMKGKGHKKTTSSAAPSPKADDGALAPPPPMAHLVNNNRDRSGSTSSALTDGSAPRGVGVYGNRSVSAPGAGSSSGGSQSASPTSSRYNRRESYTSGRDQSDIDRRGSAIEVLARQSAHEANHAPYPPHSFRPHTQTSSFSNSSLLMPTVETPPPGVNGANAFFPQQQQLRDREQRDQNGPTSPNRYKNLPPLPPGGDIHYSQPLSHSPDSLRDSYGPGHFASAGRSGQPRASFDPLTDPRQRLNPPMNPRMAQSMYAQPSAGGSALSFPANGQGMGGDWPPPRRIGGDDGRSVKGRKGLKSFFGGARAGRVA